jgi:hypothetical protein
MERLQWNPVRRCPYCDKHRVRRSRRRGVFESVVLPMLLLRPFRCLECNRRHYNIVFSKRAKR